MISWVPRRWAKEGYFEGTDYAANSLFASVEKKFNDKHSLNFTSIYAQNSRGKNSPNKQEVTDLGGVKYNSYWGWQDGKKRNSDKKESAAKSKFKADKPAVAVKNEEEKDVLETLILWRNNPDTWNQ